LNALLDDLATAPRRRRGFADLTARARLDLLRERTRAIAQGREADRDLVQLAVALAAAPFQPDPEEYGSVPVAL
jgi:hypothetical protein